MLNQVRPFPHPCLLRFLPLNPVIFTHQRKYLCRSKAIQVRLNATSLENWARLNHIPSKIVPHHFSPFNQLLSWLQCLSSEATIDGMIGTIQSLRSLNPVVLLKVVKDYRYEVGESKIDGTCLQYLQQIQEQWSERIKGDLAEQEDQSRANTTPSKREMNCSEASTSYSMTDSEFDQQAAAIRMIDEASNKDLQMSRYCPSVVPEPIGELLNSRHMVRLDLYYWCRSFSSCAYILREQLPFALPTSPSLLIPFGLPDALGPFAMPSACYSRRNNHSTSTTLTPSTSHPSTPLTPSTSTSLSPSLRTTVDTSFASSSRPGSSDTASSLHSISNNNQPNFVPVLPSDFFSLLDASKASYRSHTLRTTLEEANKTPISSKHANNNATPNVIRKASPLRSSGLKEMRLVEQERAEGNPVMGSGTSAIGSPAAKGFFEGLVVGFRTPGS